MASEKREIDYSNCGRKDNQKMKPWLIYQYLLKETDENHFKTADELAAFLSDYDISAERKSIGRDINAINITLIMLREEMTAGEAEKYLGTATNEDLPIRHKPKKGYYVGEPPYPFEEIRLLAECIYSSKFISQKNADELLSIVFENISTPQAKKITHNALVVDRVKTTNNRVFIYVETINRAIENDCQISFKYQETSIKNVNQKIEKRNGKLYRESPYQLVINDGNYYLLTYNQYLKKPITYRVDRMVSVECLDKPRAGAEEMKNIDINQYIYHHFSMFSGDPYSIKLRMKNELLDTAVEKFGTKEATYQKEDNDYFIVRAEINVSNQFFGWLCGFGADVQLLSPEPVVSRFIQYLDNIQKQYSQIQ